MAKVNWGKVKNEYITTNISQRKLAEKYKINLTTLSGKSRSEHWLESRKEYRDKIQTKSLQKIEQKEVKNEVDRLTKILNIADDLTDKLAQAVKELDIYVAKDKVKTKEIEYDKVSGLKPVKEFLVEKEVVTEVHTVVNVLQAQQIATALKTLKDINTSIGTSDEETESDGLLEALDKQIEDIFELEDDSSLLPLEEAD